ncbi:MAG: acetolactate synthase-1/2/3 large subunit [Ilumatobacter sp.]
MGCELDAATVAVLQALSTMVARIYDYYPRIDIKAESLAARLARSLSTAGSTVMFGVPGGGPNLDVVGAAIAEGLRFHLAHGETAAAIMASTHALLTRTPTAVVATRGPGATSIANGVAQATLDRYPLLAITDTVPANVRDRVPHQRIDQRSMFTPIAKASRTVGIDIESAALTALIECAQTWPFGAVHLDYDVSGQSAVETPLVARSLASEQVVEDACRILAAASRPLVIVGMEAAAIGDPIRLALEHFAAPVLTTYQAIGLVPTEGPLHAGLFTNGALEREVIDAADVIVTIGLDLVEPIPAAWTSRAPVVRLSADVQVDEYLPATVDLVGDLADAARRVLRDPKPWGDDAAAVFRVASRNSIRACESDSKFGPVQLVDTVSAAMQPSSTVTVDAGAHFLAIMPLWPVSNPFDLLISNGLATMGFAVPAAIGAAVARPGRPVVALVGDGGLGMTMAELETIGRLDLPVTVVVFNDAALSLIEIKQNDGHGGSNAVKYCETDFAAIAKASGIGGVIVRSADELRAALDGDWQQPRLIDARIDPSSYRALIAATRG